jgi:hypothetical protein
VTAPQVLRQHGRSVLGCWPHPIMAAIRGHGEFVAGALRATTCPNGTGRLPAEHVADFSRDRPSYVVYSYATPIAWHGRRGWVIPDECYSLTTTRHQGFAHQATS